MRMPTESLERSLSQILEGVLLWAEDPKNKFKLKVCFDKSSQQYPLVRTQLIIFIRQPTDWLRLFICFTGPGDRGAPGPPMRLRSRGAQHP